MVVFRKNVIVNKRKFLITGCGRSGTKYISFLLRRLGMDVPHERIGRDGAASWYMVVDTAHVPFGDSARGFQFDLVFHQVRHPLSAITSIETMKEQSWRFICAHTPIDMHEPLRLRCAKYWYYWNLKVEKIADWRYRLEDFHLAYPTFCKKLNLKSDPEVLKNLSNNVNTRRLGKAFHLYQELCERLNLKISPTIAVWLSITSRTGSGETLSWDMLNELDLRLSKKIMAKAREYGYSY